MPYSTTTILALSLFIAFALSFVYRHLTGGSQIQRLVGPKRGSLFWGVDLALLHNYIADVDLFADWSEVWGNVYRIPTVLGGQRLVLLDPTAVSHIVHTHDNYQRPSGIRDMLHRLAGPGLLWAEGDVHRRQRRILAPAFTNQRLRDIYPVLLECAEKVRTEWARSEKGASAVDIDAHSWMSRLTLDSIGISAFQFDFGSISGQASRIANAVDAFAQLAQTPLNVVAPLFLHVFPFIYRVPTARIRMMLELHASLRGAGAAIIENYKQSKDDPAYAGSARLITSLANAHLERNQMKNLSEFELISTINTTILAGYETTAVTLAWALYELSNNLACQSQLRAEIEAFQEDPTFEQMQHEMPYLEGVVREVVRLRPAFNDFARVAACDDVIPLSTPIVTKDGRSIDSIVIKKGEDLVIPVRALNRRKELWGNDASEFRPSRWLEERSHTRKSGGKLAADFSFSDGPRNCIGQGYAILAMKTALFVLIRNYVVAPSLRDQAVDSFKGLLFRPRSVGEKDCHLYLTVSPVSESSVPPTLS
ncbi:cytochrome P450 [Athelia psychrophila]|uniref:Cytochrome P450 n=1 Tax=Athelia psychrophila TaxID=1759441 RepID=A0A166EN44_9AGAM|nr:cytochrome P450 [Fibularhizoctonia sp. CBS 109695]